MVFSKNRPNFQFFGRFQSSTIDRHSNFFLRKAHPNSEIIYKIAWGKLNRPKNRWNHNFHFFSGCLRGFGLCDHEYGYEKSLRWTIVSTSIFSNHNVQMFGKLTCEPSFVHCGNVSNPDSLSPRPKPPLSVKYKAMNFWACTEYHWLA